MLALERKFKIIAAKHPDWPSNIQFWKTLQENYYSERTVRSNFFRLVDKDDYAPSEMKGLLTNLMAGRKRREDGMKSGVRSDLRTIATEDVKSSTSRNIPP